MRRKLSPLFLPLLFLLSAAGCETASYPYFIKADVKGFPIKIGPEFEIMARPCFETFYTNTITIPESLPETGSFYISSKKDEPAVFTVDDALCFDGEQVSGGYGVSYRVPRDYLEEHRGQDVEITYIDLQCAVAGASELWLIHVDDEGEVR